MRSAADVIASADRIRCLVVLIGRSVSRRVLRRGLLRSLGARIGVGAGSFVVMAIAVAIGIGIFSSTELTPVEWRYLFGLTSGSAVLWTQAAFLAVRVLFLNADEMHLLAFHLPLSTRERAMGFLVLEGLIVVAGGSLGLAVFAIAALTQLGSAALGLVCLYLAVPVVASYAVLQALTTVVMRLLGVLRIARLRRVVLIVALAALAAVSVEATGSFVVRGAEGAPPSPYAALVDLARATLPAWPATFAAIVVAVVAAAIVLAIVAAPREHVPSSAFAPVRIGPLGRGPLGAHALHLLRSQQTALAVVLAIVVLALLVTRPIVHPGVALAVLALPGLYQYAGTRPLRRMQGRRWPAWWTYLALVLPQACMLASAALVTAALLLLVRPQLVDGLGGFVLGGGVGIVVVTAVGVAFPSEESNPFSALVGTTVAAFALGAVTLLVGLVRPSQEALVAIVAGVVLVLVAATILGIQATERRPAPCGS